MGTKAQRNRQRQRELEIAARATLSGKRCRLTPGTPEYQRMIKSMAEMLSDEELDGLLGPKEAMKKSRANLPATRRPKKEGLPKRELRKAKDPAARGWVSQAARAAGAAGEFVRPSIQVNAPISNSVVT